MRVLRVSMYTPNDANPTTTVLRESDLNCTLAQAIEHMRAPSVWTSVEIFTVPAGTSIEAATFEALRRQQASVDDERNQARAFYWYAQTLCRVRDGGVITATRPAPLTAAQLEEVAAAFAKLPTYRQQTLLQIAVDGRIVRLTAGQITVEAAPMNEQETPRDP